MGTRYEGKGEGRVGRTEGERDGRGDGGRDGETEGRSLKEQEDVVFNLNRGAR